MGCAALAQVAPANAFAAPGDKFTVLKEGFDHVPLSRVNLWPSRFAFQRAENLVATDEIVITDRWFNDSFGHFAINKLRCAFVDNLPLGPVDLKGRVSCTWRDVGSDSDGQRLDASVVIDHIHIGYDSLSKGQTNVAIVQATTGLSLCSETTSDQEGVNSKAAGRPVRQRVTFAFTRPDGSPMKGQINFCLRDLDVYTSDLRADYAEGITVLSGFGDKVWLSADTTVSANPKTGLIKTGSTDPKWNDPDTHRSQAFILASPNFSFEWQGSNCGTGVFSTLQAANGRGGATKAPERANWL